MTLQEIQQALDGLFQRGEYERVEPFLLEHIASAEGRNDPATALSLLNELMGYYRSVSRLHEAIAASDKALALLEAMGLKQSPHYATTLLNVATAYRADGQTGRAIELFEEVRRRFSALNVQDSYLIATLHNNLSMAWQEAGEHEKAIASLQTALPLIRARASNGADLAVTLTNLALSQSALGQQSEARVSLGEAVSLFEALPRKSGHYPAALAALAGLEYQEGRAAEAVSLYEKSLAEIEARYGKNRDYLITLESLALACETLDPARSRKLEDEARQLAASLD